MESGIFLSPEKLSRPVICCFRAQWRTNEAKKNVSTRGRALISRRNTDEFRNDTTFNELFQVKTSKTAPSPKWKFVKSENPFHLNERLTAQQGAFLCPADIE